MHSLVLISWLLSANKSSHPNVFGHQFSKLLAQFLCTMSEHKSPVTHYLGLDSTDTCNLIHFSHRPNLIHIACAQISNIVFTICPIFPTNCGSLKFKVKVVHPRIVSKMDDPSNVSCRSNDFVNQVNNLLCYLRKLTLRMEHNLFHSF